MCRTFVGRKSCFSNCICDQSFCQCDVVNDLTATKLEGYCEQQGFIGSFLTSAKENIGVEEAFKSLANHVTQFTAIFKFFMLANLRN